MEQGYSFTSSQIESYDNVFFVSHEISLVKYMAVNHFMYIRFSLGNIYMKICGNCKAEPPDDAWKPMIYMFLGNFGFHYTTIWFFLACPK